MPKPTHEQLPQPTREQRLAAQLRANLKRRKAQARELDQASQPLPKPEPPR